MAEFTESPIDVEAEEYKVGGSQILTVALHGPSPWELYVDGKANQEGYGVGLVKCLQTESPLKNP